LITPSGVRRSDDAFYTVMNRKAQAYYSRLLRRRSLRTQAIVPALAASIEIRAAACRTGLASAAGVLGVLAIAADATPAPKIGPRYSFMYCVMRMAIVSGTARRDAPIIDRLPFQSPLVS
jgi:hypothetical protein